MPDHVDPASLAQEAAGNAADGGNTGSADNAVPLPRDNPFSAMDKAMTSQEGAADARRSKRLPVIVLWLVAIIVIVVDQASKQWALSALSDGRHTELFGRALGLVLVRNPGAAFSFATGQTWIFALIASCVVAIIIRVSRNLASGSWAVALGLVLGGAVGNLIDRLLREPGFLRGHVIDFIDMENQKHQRDVENVLRDALKENGIGRPSTRAAIIQTLFRRGYIRRRNKSLEATPTGVELIGVIKEELLKSAELTGQWENKLRRIEHHDYSASQFIAELKQMVCELVDTVLRDTDARRVTASAELPAKLAAKQGTNASSSTSSPSAEKPKRKVIRAGSTCPQCGEGKVIKGNTAYGCSRWKEGCNWRKPFKK